VSASVVSRGVEALEAGVFAAGIGTTVGSAGVNEGLSHANVRSELECDFYV
jgi:hypothetical protein